MSGAKKLGQLHSHGSNTLKYLLLFVVLAYFVFCFVCFFFSAKTSCLAVGVNSSSGKHM